MSSGGTELFELTGPRPDQRAAFHAMLASGCLFGALVGIWVPEMFDLETPPGYWAILATMSAPPLIWLAISLWQLRRRVPHLAELSDTTLRLRGALSLRREVVVSLRRLAGVERAPSRKRPIIVVPRRWGVPVVVGGAGLDRAEMDRFLDALFRRVESLPGAAGDTLRLRRRWAASARLRFQPPIDFALFVAALFGVYLWQISTGGMPLGIDHPVASYAAKVDDLRAGRWIGLLTGNFIHLSHMHFALNAAALTAIGVGVRQVLGVARFYALLSVSGAIAMWAGLTFGSNAGVAGASGMVYGCFGFGLWTWIRGGGTVPSRIALAPHLWAYLVATIVQEMSLPTISGAGHAGGLLCGFVLSELLMWGSTVDGRLGVDPRAPKPEPALR